MSEIKKTENELAVKSGFVSTEGMDILREALADDCQRMDFSFDKISIPTGGVTMFQLPEEDENGNAMAKEVTGVILYNHPAFAYYSQKYTGESLSPRSFVLSNQISIFRCLGKHFSRFGINIERAIFILHLNKII